MMSETPDQPDHIDIAPSVILDARAGFIALLEKAGYTPDQLFDTLVLEGYVTTKFYVVMAQRYHV